MKHVILALQLFLGTLNGFAQDPPFSLLYAYPNLMNSSLAGDIPNEHQGRGGILYRTQWFDMLSEPYTNFAVSADFLLPVCLNNRSSIGMGVHVVSERIPFTQSEASLKSSNAVLSIAYKKGLDDKGKNYLSAGLEGEFIHRYMDPEGFQFPAQFDGMGGFDGTLPTRENHFPERPININRLSLGMGASLVLSNFEKFRPQQFQHAVRIGISWKHINRPNLSVIGNIEDEEARISHRWISHIRWMLDNPDNFQFQSYAIYQQQGKHVWQTLFGLEGGRYFSDDIISFGSGIRLSNPQETNELLTDLIINLRWRTPKYFLTLNFDLGLSSFANAGNDKTAMAFELAIGCFLWKQKRNGSSKCIPCPNF